MHIVMYDDRGLIIRTVPLDYQGAQKVQTTLDTVEQEQEARSPFPIGVPTK